MARILKSFPVRKYSPGALKHPYKDWTDGRVWELKRGEDFDCGLHSIAGSFLKYARDHGMIGRTSILKDFDAVVVQATTDTEFKD